MKILAPWGLWLLVSIALGLGGRWYSQHAIAWTGMGLFVAWLIVTAVAIGLMAWLICREDDEEEAW